MAEKYNIDEVFDLAVEIEINGGKFYRRAAGLFADPAFKQMMEKLAAMEDDHVIIFSKLKKDLVRETKDETNYYDPFGEAALYLKAFTAGKVFKTKGEIEDLLAQVTAIADIFKIAIGLEKDSIAYYLGIKEIVPQDLGKAKIDQIIKEEMKHIRMLSKGEIT